MSAADRPGIERALDDYNLFHDQRRSADWVDLFLPDARYVVHGRVYEGHDGLWRFLRERRDGAGKHMNGVPLVTPVGRDECRVELDYVGFRRAAGRIEVGGTGRYRDHLRRCADGRWRFAERRIEGALLDDSAITHPRTSDHVPARPSREPMRE